MRHAAHEMRSYYNNWLTSRCRTEVSWLKVHIAARRVQEIAPSAINADDEEALVHYILNFINTQYNYNLLNDKQLHADLLTHIKTMITRVLPDHDPQPTTGKY